MLVAKYLAKIMRPTKVLLFQYEEVNPVINDDTDDDENTFR